MANTKPKKRAMRSRRSGVKKLELVKANISILSKLTALFAIILLFPLLSFSQVSSGDKLVGVIHHKQPNQHQMFNHQYHNKIM